MSCGVWLCGKRDVEGEGRGAAVWWTMEGQVQTRLAAMRMLGSQHNRTA